MLIRILLFVSLGYVIPPSALAETYYVAKSGVAGNDGSQQAPFGSINAAARVARPGDEIIVGGGVYREWVDPVRGGASEETRITYRAADGETAIISGSDLVRGWRREGEIWRLDIQEEAFGPFNPYVEGIRHPQYVEVDEAGDGWGWLKYGRWTHRGDVIFRGSGLTEQETIDGLTISDTWHTQTIDGITTIWANFGDSDPNEFGVELSMRPYGFYPSRPGLNYITVSGFVVANIATHWAPPTVPQPGAIGPNGGHHWIIENNIVLHSRTVAISIGNPTGEADFQRSGSHVVRDNILLRNGQGGIAGQIWNHNSIVQGNWIEDTNYRREFGGWETAGIKIHNADNLLIEGNVIRNVSTIDPELGAAHGIWIDYQNHNVRVSRNIISDVEAASILTEANWKGPVMIDHNVVLGGEFSTYSSSGDLWIHNLFVDAAGRWENQDWGDRIPVSNTRWLRNIFVQQGLGDLPAETPNTKVTGNLYLDGAIVSAFDVDDAVSAATEGVEVTWTDAFSGSLSFNWVDDDTVLLATDVLALDFEHPDLQDFAPEPKRTDLNSFDLTFDMTGTARAASGFAYGPWTDLQAGETLTFGAHFDDDLSTM